MSQLKARTKIAIRNNENGVNNETIDSQTTHPELLSLKEEFKKNNDKLNESLTEIKKQLSETAVNVLLDIVKEFVRENNKDILTNLYQRIGFEKYLDDAFNALKTFTNKNETNIDTYLRKGDDIRQQAIYLIEQYYDQFRPVYESNEDCKKCGGQFYLTKLSN